MAEAFGDWELTRLIAVGGLGEVWAGRHAQGELAAIKRLHTHLGRNDEALAMFALEQRLATTLPRHASLVHAVATGAVGDRPFVALGLAPGEDLRRLLAPSPTPTAPARAPARLSPGRAIAIVRAACEAAAHLHHAGWVHGDLNPGNLIVALDEAEGAPGSDGVIVCDLGIARAIGAGGPVRGTHAYMAPEQIRGEAWTPATDVFALGVILHELVTGVRLFHRGPSWLSMAAVMEHAPAPLADPGLDAIVQAALDKDPIRRTASAKALALRLRDHVRGA
jgi:serine/threonine-protein kinase